MSDATITPNPKPATTSTTQSTASIIVAAAIPRRIFSGSATTEHVEIKVAENDDGTVTINGVKKTRAQIRAEFRAKKHVTFKEDSQPQDNHYDQTTEYKVPASRSY